MNSNPTTGKWFLSCPGTNTRALGGVSVLNFQDGWRSPLSALVFVFFLPVFSPLCRNTVGGRLHSCSGRRLSLHKCPSFISQAEERLYRSGWLAIMAAGVERHMTLPHSLPEFSHDRVTYHPKSASSPPGENDLRSGNQIHVAGSSAGCLWLMEHFQPFKLHTVIRFQVFAADPVGIKKIGAESFRVATFQCKLSDFFPLFSFTKDFTPLTMNFQSFL